jgi:hypothetical protein
MRLLSRLFVIWLGTCVGCGGGGELVPVEGAVTLDGRPMAGIQVVYDQPELGANANQGYGGKTDEQGRYVLLPILGKGTGAPPGKYRVSLSTPADPLAIATPQAGAGQTTIFFPEAPPPPPERVPPAYRGGVLSFTVPAEGTGEADFHLKSK